jgi:N-methylhydantoinase A
MIRIGLDVGGTFTDVVALDETTGATTWTKVLTDVESPSAGVLAAIDATGVPYPEIAAIRLGTTLGVNALLTGSGARTGLITTRGFRDVLEIRRTHRQTLFDLDERVPAPLVPRELRLEVDERIDANGDVVRPLDEESVRAAWHELRAAGVESVAVVFLFSFENASHEQRAREILVEEGAQRVFLSSDVLPAYREYERTSTTVAAARIAPVVEEYVGLLDERLGERGVHGDRLAIMTNSGGAVGAHTVAELPISTLLSGPAGGVEAARRLAAQAGWSDLVTLDMGGTSCDVSGIVAGVVDERLDMSVSGHVISYPTYDIETIGAGGGSIAWVDSGGTLRVGPRSAGSLPGPACYGRGGEEPTVTDANLVLGRYDPDALLGGTVRLDLEAAERAIRRVAEPLGLGIEQAAAGILRIVNILMTNAVRVISVERGRDVREFTLVAYGGAGPTHAAEIARELAIPRVLVPPFPGCASAFGAVISGGRRDFVRTVARRSDEVTASALDELTVGMRTRAAEALRAEGFPDELMRIEPWLDLRYQGQSHPLSVPHAEATVTDDTVAAAIEAFHTLHRQLYGHSFSDVPVEIVNVRVKGLAHRPDPEMWWDWARTAEGAQTLRRARPVHMGEGRGVMDAAVLQRHDLGVNERIDGPAVVHQLDSTVLVPPGFTAVALAGGSLLLSASTPAEPAAPELAGQVAAT